MLIGFALKNHIPNVNYVGSWFPLIKYLAAPGKLARFRMVLSVTGSGAGAMNSAGLNSPDDLLHVVPALSEHFVGNRTVTMFIDELRYQMVEHRLLYS
jgi:hypothetical protein